MEYVILMNKDKELITTIPSPVYQGEYNSTKLKFIIPKIYINLIPTLQIILPNNTGKIRICTFDEGLYKDNWLTITIPVVAALTKYAGNSQLWISFLSQDGQETTVKTSFGELKIIEHKGYSDIVDNEFEDINTITQDITELKVAVKTLENTKATSIKLENNNLCLVSGDNLLSTVELPDDVTWEMLV